MTSRAAANEPAEPLAPIDGISITARRTLGIWALVIGAIRVKLAPDAIRQRQAESRSGFSVARRPLRGLVELVAEG